jgi:two-component system cell cycle response regulator
MTHAEALEKAEMLRSEVSVLKPADVELTISIGLASMQDHPDSNLTTILALADKALYHSKETGRNRVSYISAEGECTSPFDENSDQ